MSPARVSIIVAAAIALAVSSSFAQITVSKSGGVALGGRSPTTVAFLLDERDSGGGSHPLYRVGAESSIFVSGYSGSAGGSGQVTDYICDVPAEIQLNPGVYRFTTTANVLTGRKFDIRADGEAQTWKIHYGSPVLGFMSEYIGWMAVGVGGMISVMCLIYGDDPDDQEMTESRHKAIIGGLAVAAGGGGLILLTVPLRPSAKRIR
jgi:hypothetical protein